MNKEYSVAELVPHSGKMSLLSQIIDYGDEWLTAEVHIHEDSTFYENGGVPAWIGIEYMAQAVGAYSGLQERLVGEKPKLGFLLGTRNYNCNVTQFPNGAKLIIKVERELQGENGLSAFQCSFTADGVEAAASLNVYQPESAEQFLQEVI